jgi:hypothetical protein
VIPSRKQEHHHGSMPVLVRSIQHEVSAITSQAHFKHVRLLRAVVYGIEPLLPPPPRCARQDEAQSYICCTLSLAAAVSHADTAQCTHKDHSKHTQIKFCLLREDRFSLTFLSISIDKAQLTCLSLSINTIIITFP